MKNKGLVSIIIPCFQQAHLLNRLLLSIANQTYKNIEVIIIDDGSTPALDIKNDFDLDLKLIRQVNSGLASARNTGINHARGEYLKFIDADDEITPRCIELQTLSCKGKNCINVIGFIDAYEHKSWEHIIPAFGDPISTLLIANPAPVHSYLFTRDLFDENRFCTTERVNGGCEDYDLLFRLAINGAIFTTVHEYGAIYHRSPNSMSSYIDNMQRTRVSVWAYNVKNILENQVLVERYLSVILASYALMYEVIKSEYFYKLRAVEGDIFRSCLSFYDQLDAGITRSVLDKLKKTKSDSELVLFLEQKKSCALDNIKINNQSIVDYRLRLTGYDNFFDLEYLIKIIGLAFKYHSNFSLYGAGIIGGKLFSLLSNSGLQPKKIYDRNFHNINKTYAIPVVSPNDISIDKPDLIIIASLSFRDEIFEGIKQISSDVIII